MTAATATEAVPLTVVVAIYGADEVSETADVYARMVDDVALFCSESDAARTPVGARMLDRLGALHVELDELTGRAPEPGELSRLADVAANLAGVAYLIEDPWFAVAHRSLTELHEALDELIDNEQEG